MRPGPSILSHLESAPRRELYYFALFRLLEAGVLAGLIFSPLSNLLADPPHPQLAIATSIGYLLAALALYVFGRNVRWLVPIVLLGVCVDIMAAGLVTDALPDSAAGVAMMLLFNVAAAALLLPSAQLSLAVTMLAIGVLFGEHFWRDGGHAEATRSMPDLIMFSVAYLSVGYLAHQAGTRARRGHELAEQRGAEVANLYEINELIIRRMRTGVLVVDADNRIKLANEAASLLLGESAEASGGNEDPASLLHASPKLYRRLQAWRNGWNQDETPMQLSPNQAEVQPRFARLLADSDTSLVFLDDASVVSRRAESLTLAALGRFSASLAHEIRNPLAAINYAVQLLQESQQIVDGDRRLLQIIHQQCQRTNGIVESVLGLARRERASAVHIELNHFAQRFVEEYRQNLSIETDSLLAVTSASPVPVMADLGHLQQIVTVLVHNALNYGRLPGQSARVQLRVSFTQHRPVIDVMDRGPGIPEAVAAQLFRPFFTTSEHGTGLGLYIARELCRANQATLEYIAVPGGGSCFRITLPGPNALQASPH